MAGGAVMGERASEQSTARRVAVARAYGSATGPDRIGMHQHGVIMNFTGQENPLWTVEYTERLCAPLAV